MRTGGRLIEKYIIRAVVPYLLLSLLLLTAILFTQQAGRFGELLMGTRVPLQMVGDLALLVLPNVLVFTLPMALLTGILIGFSSMGSDSELTAMRAAGVGTWKMLWPILLLGTILTAPSLFVNLKLAPDSARALRRVGTHAALYKLDSPVEPRTFNTDFPPNIIYVRDGDKTQGQWEGVFLYTEAQDGSVRIVTARSGRIDSAGEKSELVLSDAVQITLPGNKVNTQDSYITEHLDQLRVVLDTGRKAVLDLLQKGESDPKPSEMSWDDLSEYAASTTGLNKREAKTLMQKRLAMSLTPLVFAFLGSALGLRIRKGGRGLGVLLSVLVMLVYYLLTLAGEQMGRAGTVAPFTGAWLASATTIIFSLALLKAGQRNFLWATEFSWKSRISTSVLSTFSITRKQKNLIGKARLLNFPSLIDLNILRTTTLSFALAFISLVAIFLIFTLFELWRFVIAKGIGLWFLGEYLLFLLPLVCVQLLPASVLISVLTAYALMSRRSEAIAWWASGQSIYRLMLPGLIFAACLGSCLWVVQENLMPQANIRQDILRSQIRGEVSRATVNFNKQWLASAESGRLYSYEFREPGSLRNPVMYEFDGDRIHLQRILKGEQAQWISKDRISIKSAESLIFRKARIEREEQVSTEVGQVEHLEVFRPIGDKPSHLSTKGLSNYIKNLNRRGGDAAAMIVALQRKYADPFSPLVMAIAAIPLALSFGRKSTITALCLAIFIGLIFWAASESLRQLGEHGLVSPIVAAWSSPMIFAAIGIYLTARSRT